MTSGAPAALPAFLPAWGRGETQSIVGALGEHHRDNIETMTGNHHCVFLILSLWTMKHFPPPLRLSLEILRETQCRTNAENVPGGCGGCGTYQSAHGDVFVQQHDRTHVRTPKTLGWQVGTMDEIISYTKAHEKKKFASWQTHSDTHLYIWNHLSNVCGVWILKIFFFFRFYCQLAHLEQLFQNRERFSIKK